MSKDILVVAEPFRGQLSEVTFEMLGRARELAGATGGAVVALLLGNEVGFLARRLGAADRVLLVEDEWLSGFNPETQTKVIAPILTEAQPYLTMLGATSAGLDLAASLSAVLDLPLVAYCRDLKIEGGRLVATSQLYGGKMFVESEVVAHPAIASILPGAFRAEAGHSGRVPPIEARALDVAREGVRVQFRRLIEPKAGDVDITQAEVLVSIGRGIQNQDNVALAEELAEALGGAVSASRPVVDQGWLPLTRQVGRSGMIVKPKLYLSLGISGAPEHIEGMRDSDLIIAVNTDPAAPIFGVAHYGVVADVLDVLPALTAEIRKVPHPA